MPQKYEKPEVGDVFVSIWPRGEKEYGTVIGVKVGNGPEGWSAVINSGFRNPYRIAYGDQWNDRSQWHPLAVDELLWPDATEVEASAPLDVEAIIDAIPAVQESKRARKGV
jgi:hypothetical protein